jgi:hypothetical protein
MRVPRVPLADDIVVWAPMNAALLPVNHQDVMPVGICNKPGGVRTGLDRTAYQVEMVADKIPRQPVPRHGHRRMSYPTVTLGIECFDCCIGAPYIAMQSM